MKTYFSVVKNGSHYRVQFVKNGIIGKMIPYFGDMKLAQKYCNALTLKQPCIDCYDDNGELLGRVPGLELQTDII